MSEFDSLLQGMNLILTPGHIGLMVVGVLLGILVGVLPGLGAPNGVALLLPITFTMSPVSAIILLSCMYWGGVVRRIDHLDPLQHSRRAVIGGHDLRRLSHGS